MVAAKGNKYAVKLKTPELKRKAYEQYCEHIASGKSKEGWYFEHPELSLTYKSIEKYIAESPQDFPPINKELAEAKSFLKWEDKGQKMMDGKKRAETALYQMFMRNKFGWDKKESEEKKLDVEKLEILADFMKKAYP